MTPIPIPLSRIDVSVIAIPNIRHMNKQNYNSHHFESFYNLIVNTNKVKYGKSSK